MIKARPDGGDIMPYGFMSGADAGDRATLGQTAVSGATPVTGIPIVFGVNRPKPARMTKIKATGSESSFVAFANIAAAKASDWTITSPAKYALPRTTKKQVAVFVETNGLSSNGATVKYAWMMDKGDVQAFGSILGIKTVGANDDVVFGASHPKPANIVTVVEGRSTGSFVGDVQYDTVVIGGNWVVRKAAQPPK